MGQGRYLTLEEAAKDVGRPVSWVKGCICRGELDGKLEGRKWLVSVESLSRPAVRPYPHRATRKFFPGTQVEFVSVMLVSMARIPVGIVVPQKALLTSHESIVSVQEGLDWRICCTVVYHIEGLVYKDHYISETGDFALDRQQPGFLKDELYSNLQKN